MPSDRIMRLATDAAREDIAAVLATLRPLGPVPEPMWRDPYVIGYLAGIGGMAAEDVTDGRLSERHLTTVAFRALCALSGKIPAEQRAAVEGGQPGALEAFEDGFFAACKVAAVANGDNMFDSDPDVIDARDFVIASAAAFDRDGAPPDEQARIIATLESALFVTYVVTTYFPDSAGYHTMPGANP